VDSGRYAAAADDPDSVSRVLKRHDIKGIGYLLYVGRLEDKKNVSGLLAAYEILHLVLKEETPELVLVGSRGRGADEALAGMSAAARSRVRLLGFTDDDDLPFIYAGALALFFPSFYEGFGLPVLEAFGARIPVLCSKVASLPEVAGGAAEYLDPTVNQQMAEALLRICQDAGRRRELVERGTARLSGFTWRRVAERTWQEIGGGF
jgi:alpha-1,3-rhamnosyl/mannosyltransferase